MVEFGSDMTKYIDQAMRHVSGRFMRTAIPSEAVHHNSYSTYNGNQAGIGNHVWTLRWPYCLDAGEPYDIRTDTNSMFYYLWRKYVTEYDECTTRWVYHENILLCRYAEILLRRAECLNELNRTNEAIQYVDMVRRRAGHIQLSNPACKTPHSTQAEMRDLIRNEMYVELGGEDSMFYNELRWEVWYDLKYRDTTCKVGAMNTNGLMEIWGTLKYNNVSVGEHMKIYYPGKEREMNPNLTQNPGLIKIRLVSDKIEPQQNFGPCWGFQSHIEMPLGYCNRCYTDWLILRS